MSRWRCRAARGGVCHCQPVADSSRTCIRSRSGLKIYRALCAVPPFVASRKGRLGAKLPEMMRKAVMRDGGQPPRGEEPVQQRAHPGGAGTFSAGKVYPFVRDPYQVFLSTRHLYHTVGPCSQLQTVNSEQIDVYVLDFLQLFAWKQYLADRAAYPRQPG